MKVAIVGAGPAGLACAVKLTESGHTLTVFEKKKDLSLQGSGVMIQPIGLEAAEHLGIRKDIEQLGQRISVIRGHRSPSGRIAIAADYQHLHGINYALGLKRKALWDTLFSRINDKAIEFLANTDIESYTDHSSTHTSLVDSRGRSHGPFDLVIDAAGVHSKLQSQAGLSKEKKELDYGSLWANVNLENDSRFNAEAMHTCIGKLNRAIGIMPTGQLAVGQPHTASIFFNLAWKECPHWNKNSFSQWRDTSIEQWPEAELLISQITHPEQLHLAKFSQNTLSTPVKNNIVFVGDAAHASSPQLGQGVNMSLIDAVVLCHSLRKHQNLPRALAHYRNARKHHVWIYQYLAKVLTPFYQSNNTLAIYARDVITPMCFNLSVARMVTGYILSGRAGAPLNGID